MSLKERVDALFEKIDKASTSVPDAPISKLKYVCYDLMAEFAIESLDVVVAYEIIK